MQVAARDLVAAITPQSVGQYKKRCPYCQDERKKHTRDTPLSIKVDGSGVTYFCHHCEKSGGWQTKDNVLHMPVTVNQDSEDVQQYLIDRGIKASVITDFTLSGTYRFNGKHQPAVGFPYRSGDVTAVKWRSVDSSKRFSQQNVCEDFFLLENYKPGNSILICEGELDALAWMSAGLPDDVSVVSVPNGAPAKVKDGKIEPEEDRRFKYVYRAKTQLDQAPRIYINTDNDEPGRALAEELSRRIGRAKTWTVDLGSYKDSNEALKAQGAGYLLTRLAESKPLPMLGLHEAYEFGESFVDLYENGQMEGAKVGLAGVDKMISIPLGMLSVVTGFPGSGKSDLIDQFCVNLARDYGWKTCFCSFEKQPRYHMAQLAQKVTGKAFFPARSVAEELEWGIDSVNRMTPEERDWAIDWITNNFMFMDSSKGAPTDIDGILDFASVAVMRMGVRILVIDPYNYITGHRGDKETDAISTMLTKVQKWAKEHDAHVFFIAHPTKPAPDRRGKKVICTGLDVSGSMAWFAKADIGMTCYRSETDESEFHVWKARWSWMGTVGHCGLRHIKGNSRWEDRDYVPEDYDWDFD